MRWLLTLAVIRCALASSAGASTPRPLIADGAARGVIVLSATPAAGECATARDLQAHLWRMTGVWVPIVETDATVSVPAIVVGRHPANEPLSATLEQRYPTTLARHRDAFAIGGDGHHLRLVGASATATFWAGCAWLESLGVRWLFPHPELGDYVPMADAIVVGVGERFEAPSFDLRHVLQDEREPVVVDAIHGVGVHAIFALRKRLSGTNPLSPTDGFVRTAPGHSYLDYLPPERYFAAHPEWYELRDGVRTPTQLCTSSEGAAAAVARAVVLRIDALVADGYAIDRIIAPVSPEDARFDCECDRCRELVDDDGGASSRVVQFANRVAERVRATHPRAQIGVYAYARYSTPPQRVRPAPGVIPELTFWVGGALRANHARPMLGAGNRRFRDGLEGWRAVAEQLVVYTYYGHYAWFTPWPMASQIAADVPRLAALREVRGVDIESHAHWGTQADNYHLATALLWNASRDPSLVLDDFRRHAFGPAAVEVARCVAIQQERMAAIDEISGQLLGVAELIDDALIEACDAHMSAAERRIDTIDAATAWRTRLVVESWRASRRFAQVLQLLIDARDDRDRDEIMRRMDEVDAFSRTELGRWSFERRVVERQLGRLRSRVAAPLRALPGGRTQWSDSLAYGGTLALHARISWSSLAKGRTGYELASGATAAVTLPLRAEDGRRITSVTIQLVFDVADGVDVTLRASSGGIATETTMVTSSSVVEIAVPHNMLGRREVEPALVLTNRAPDQSVAVIAIAVTVDVE